MMFTEDNSTGIADLKSFLHQQFEMKDLGLLRYFLGTEVAHSPYGYLLSRLKLTNDIFQCAKHSDERTLEALLELNVKHSSTVGELLPDPTHYCRVVGSPKAQGVQAQSPQLCCNLCR